MKTLASINVIPKFFLALLLILISSICFSGNYTSISQNESSLVIVESQFEVNSHEIIVSTRTESMTECAIPVFIQDILIDKGLNHYQFVTYEKVISLKSDELVYEKLIFSSSDQIHVLYFDQLGNLMMEHKWPKGFNAISI